jgi:hypothetical protein
MTRKILYLTICSYTHKFIWTNPIKIHEKRFQSSIYTNKQDLSNLINPPIILSPNPSHFILYSYKAKLH